MKGKGLGHADRRYGCLGIFLMIMVHPSRGFINVIYEELMKEYDKNTRRNAS